MDPITLGMGALNVGQSLYNNLFGGKSPLQRIQEEKVKRMEKQNDINLELLDNQRTVLEGSRRRQRGDIKEGMSSAIKHALNAGSGSAAASGLGGSVSSPTISSMKTAGPVANVAAQEGQMLSGVEQANNAAVGQNIAERGAETLRGAQIGDMVMYDRGDQNGILDITGSLFSGLAAGKNIYDMLTLNKAEDTVPKTDADGNPTELGPNNVPVPQIVPENPELTPEANDIDLMGLLDLPETDNRNIDLNWHGLPPDETLRPPTIKKNTTDTKNYKYNSNDITSGLQQLADNSQINLEDMNGDMLRKMLLGKLPNLNINYNRRVLH